MQNLGVISDTHGLLRPQAVEALRGCQQIIHAGDVGSAEVLVQLARIAPVIAVRGNVDAAAWAARLPLSESVQVEGIRLFVLHILGDLAFDPSRQGYDAVVFGHSHQPRNEEVRGVLYFNPGSAGPRRFKLPVSVGRLIIADRTLRGEIVALST
jgi:putative phosphoesterase